MKKIPVIDHHQNLKWQVECHEQELRDYKLAIKITYWFGVASGILISLGVAGILILIITFI